MTPDIKVSGGGTIYLVRPLTDAAKQWITDNVGGETTWLGDALAVEHRYIGQLLAGMHADGLVIESE